MKTIRAMLLVAASPLALCASVAHAEEALTTGRTAAIAPQAAPGSQAPADDASQSNVAAQPSSTVKEIVVTGTRAAIQSAERAKRRSAVIIDGITADDIGQLPDVSISESLIRISGVSSNDTVRGSDQVAIRGLGPDLVSTEYNGRVLPTADPVTRRVGLAGLPTEGISAAWAQKTPDATTIEGGVAGILELETIHPLETTRHGLTLVARGLYSDTADNLDGLKGNSPFGERGEVTYVGRPAPNFGFTFSWAGINQYSAENGVQLDGWRLGNGARADLNKDGTPDALPQTAGPFVGTFSTQRNSVIAMAQWDPISGVRVSLDGLFDQDHYVQGTLRYVGFGLYNGAGAGIGAATSSTVSNGAATSFAGNVGGYRGLMGRSDVNDHTYQGGLNVAYNRGGPFKAKLDLSYASAGRDLSNPSLTYEDDAANVAGQVKPFAYDARDPSHVSFDFSPLTADDYSVATVNTVAQHATDEIKAVRADFTFQTKSFIDSLQWGLRIDHRRHTNVVDNTAYSYANVPSRPDLDSSDLQSTSNPLAGATAAFGGSSAVAFPYYDFDKLLKVGEHGTGVIVNNQYGSDVAAGADVREMNYAVYGQANLSLGRLTGNVGTRWIHTEETVLGQSGTSPANVQNEQFNHEYSYLLPSMNLRYEITPKLIGRFAASKTMSRPEFGDLSVGSAVDLTTAPASGVVTISRGNPNLKPFTSKGLDFGLEWYASKAMTLSAFYYYKWVDNFTTTATTTTTVTLTDGTVLPASITQTVNDPRTQDFRGFELQGRRDFNFLPGIWSALGVQANWNHNITSANATFTSLVGATTTVLPINLSKDVVNAQLYYSRGSVDLRAAYRYYSDYSRAYVPGYQSQPAGQIDLSMGFNLRKNLRLSGTATNVFGAHLTRYTADYRDPASTSLLQHYTFQGRAVTLGLRAQF